MTAQDVYNIANALPKEEYIHLYAMLTKDIEKSRLSQRNKIEILTDIEAQKYLLSNIFSEKCIKNKLKKM